MKCGHSSSPTRFSFPLLFFRDSLTSCPTFFFPSFPPVPSHGRWDTPHNSRWSHKLSSHATLFFFFFSFGPHHGTGFCSSFPLPSYSCPCHIVKKQWFRQHIFSPESSTMMVMGRVLFSSSSPHKLWNWYWALIEHSFSPLFWRESTLIFSLPLRYVDTITLFEVSLSSQLTFSSQISKEEEAIHPSVPPSHKHRFPSFPPFFSSPPAVYK